MIYTKYILLTFLAFIFSATAQAAVVEVEVDFNIDNNHQVVQVDEGIDTAIRLTSVNADGDVDYYIDGGDDEDLFNLDKAGSMAELSFVNIPDYENPGDVDEDNSYEVLVLAENRGEEVEWSLSVAVQDVQYGAPLMSDLEVAMNRRNVHHRPACKDTRAINFNNVGKHYEELCIYDDTENLLQMLAEAKLTLLAIQSELSRMPASSASAEYSAPVVVSVPVAPKKIIVSVYQPTNNTQVSTATTTAPAFVVQGSDNSDGGNQTEIIPIELDDISEITSEDMIALELPEEIAEDGSSQMASIAESQGGSERSGFSPLFWIILAVGLIGGWMIWRSLKEPEEKWGQWD